MSLRHVANVVGLLLIFVSAAMLTTAGVGQAMSDGTSLAFLISALITFAAGVLLFGTTRLKDDLTAREGYAIVTLAWAATGAFGALPFLLSGVVDSVPAAIFESVLMLRLVRYRVFCAVLVKRVLQAVHKLFVPLIIGESYIRTVFCLTCLFVLVSLRRQ